VNDRCGPSGIAPEVLLGHRIVYFRAGLLAAEGKPVADRLAGAGELAGSYDRLVGAMLEQGWPVPVDEARRLGDGRWTPGAAGFRRLDVTADVAMPSAADGLATLAALSSMARVVPGLRPVTWPSLDGRRLETIALYGRGRRMLGRIYDKGVESLTAPPGRVLRPESQNRFDQRMRRGVETTDAEYVRGLFHRRFVPLWQATKGVTVAGPLVLAGKLIELVEATDRRRWAAEAEKRKYVPGPRDVTASQAERLAGFMVLRATPGRRLHSRATDYRRLAELRRLGLVPTDAGELEEIEVDVAEVLEAALDTEHWRRRDG